MSGLRTAPCSMQKAKEYVGTLHRHHHPPRSGIFAVACCDSDGRVCGVAIVGRPVARLLDDGWTAEVARVSTDGTKNACSVLYGACFRAARALGYARILTYTRIDEPGASLRASGWVLDDPCIRARKWAMPGRHRVDRTEIVQRQRWVKQLAEPVSLSWPHAEPESTLSMFGGDA